MCGIFAVLGCHGYDDKFKRKVIRASKRMCHRGPDWSGYYCDNNNILCHERLSIIDLKHGKQPIISNDGNVILTVNGEIYNHKDLRNRVKDYTFTTESDCEIIIALYKLYGPHFMQYNLLRGMFSFVLYDKLHNFTVISRDHIGIIPLYYGNHNDSTIYSSELKSLLDFCRKPKVYQPGQYTINDETFTYYKPYWFDNVPCADYSPDLISMSLINAVKSHMMSDVPIGLLLSGGLDSSLIASIAQRHSKTQLKSFCIGLEGSPDIKAAEEVAKFIGTEHYSFTYTIEEGLESLDNVIYHIESCDVTTVRASVPMYLLAKRIHAMGIKVVLTGEVSDEISGSYAYFKYAPNMIHFHEETVRKLKDLNRYDLLRANKSMMAWSIETRVPFGDQTVINSIMRLSPEYKMWDDEHMEKTYLRIAFDDKTNPYLPENLLWRKKEQFSDGVGYNWVDSLKEHSNNVISDSLFSYVRNYFPVQPPKTKEEFLYRTIYQEHFPDPEYVRTLKYEDSVACSSGIAAKWHDFTNIDPSGRSVKGHINEF